MAALRERKYRKEKPFALMAKDIDVARDLVELSEEARSFADVHGAADCACACESGSAGIAPDNDELGLMLPYTPLHHLLFAAGAPEMLVMTSANRSSEPIAYEDEDARRAAFRNRRRISDRPTPHCAAGR